MKNKLQIIAEIAQGFEGNFEQSKLLIKAAAKAGLMLLNFNSSMPMNWLQKTTNTMLYSRV